MGTVGVKKTTYKVEGSKEPCFEVTNGFTMVRIAPFYHYIGRNTLAVTEYLDGAFNKTEEMAGDFDLMDKFDALRIAKSFSAYL